MAGTIRNTAINAVFRRFMAIDLRGSYPATWTANDTEVTVAGGRWKDDVGNSFRKNARTADSQWPRVLRTSVSTQPSCPKQFSYVCNSWSAEAPRSEDWRQNWVLYQDRTRIGNGYTITSARQICALWDSTNMRSLTTQQAVSALNSRKRRDRTDRERALIRATTNLFAGRDISARI
jgi:hypothetical protein